MQEFYKKGYYVERERERERNKRPLSENKGLTTEAQRKISKFLSPCLCGLYQRSIFVA